MLLKDIASMRIRLLMIGVLWVPVFFAGYPLTALYEKHDWLGFVGVWTSYTMLVNWLIARELGLRKWSTLLAVAAMCGIIPSLVGATLHYVADWVCQLAKIGHQANQEDVAAAAAGYIKNLLLIMLVVPLALFTSSSITFSEWLRRSRLKDGTVHISPMKCHLLLIQRIVNHVWEVVVGIWPLWREAMPGLIRPRTVEEKRFGVLGLKVLKMRAVSCVQAAVEVLLIFSLEPLPMFIHELHALGEASSTHRGRK